MLNARRLVVAGIIAVLATTSACVQATTKASVCEKKWSENSDTAMPHEVRGDPTASAYYSERYIELCAR